MFILSYIYVIRHYVIQLINILVLIRMSLYFLVTITREVGIRTRVTSGTVTAVTAALLGSLGLDLLDLLQFTV